MPTIRPGEEMVLGAAATLACSVLLNLIIVYFGLSFTPLTVALIWGAPLLILTWGLFTFHQPNTPRPKRSIPSLIILFLVFAGLMASRLYNLSYKEVQGDEAIVLTRTAGLILGDSQQLFLHQKGPVETLIPLTLWVLEGELTEYWFRFPFALANVLSICLFGFLIWRWSGRGKTAAIATLLLSIMGFALAFGRIVQYQSFVYLWSFAALLTADYLADQPQNSVWRRSLPGFFLAFALLAHYDAILFAPAVAWLLIFRRPLTQPLTDLWDRLWPTLLSGAFISALFYIPYMRHPNFQETFSYLLNDRVGVSVETAEPVTNGSLAIVWQMVTFYNSTPYIIGLLLLAAIGLYATWKSRLTQQGWFAIILFAAVPLLFYTLIVADPRTHVYTFFPGLICLAALGGEWVIDQLKPHSRWLTIGLLGVGVIWFAYSAQYVGRLFLDVTAEHQRNTTQAPILGDWKTWETPPQFGLFGFPYRAGWSELHDPLNRQPDLVYRSNEELPITNWYLPHLAQTGCDHADLFILAQNVQDQLPYHQGLIDSKQLVAQVMSDQRETLAIYSNLEREGKIDVTYRSNRSSWQRTPHDVLPPPHTGDVVADILMGEDVKLHGYDLDLSKAHPGGQIELVLYWSATRPIGRNYQSFVHLVTDELVGQSDQAPNCNLQPTSGWEIGRVVRDPHIIPIPADLPPTTTPTLYIGMYDLLTQVRHTVPHNPDSLYFIQTVELNGE